MIALLRVVGVGLLAASIVPGYRLLWRTTVTDVGGWLPKLLGTADGLLAYTGWGSLIILTLAAALTRFVPTRGLRARLAAAADRLTSLPLGAWAAGLGATSFALSLWAQKSLFMGFFTNVDEMASTVHARYLAAGELAGSLPGVPEAWLFPNTLLVDAGWVSHFPAGHLAVMAAFIRAGAPGLMGPALLGATSALAALALPRLLPDRPATARLAALAVAVSPFMALIGASALSHTSAGLAAVGVLYACLRARDGGAAWAVAAGAAIGLMVSSRPWIGLVLGTLIPVAVWLPELRRRSGAWAVGRVSGTILGGAPFALGLGWFNQVLFGHPTRLGYLAAFGDRHRLGFHDTPWSFYYGPVEALGFTSLDLLSLGVQLLETPVPVGVALGLYLLRGRIPRGAGILLAVALAPVAANAVYWFHDTRMYFEAGPAWLALATLAVVDLATPSSRGRPAWIADLALWAAVLSLGMAGLVGLPARIDGLAWDRETLSRITPPVPPGGSAVVFVHASWSERLAATLEGAGEMRQDSVVTALNRNTSCELHRYAVARAAARREGAAGAPLPPVDLEQVPGAPPDIVFPPGPSGTTLRVREGEVLDPVCLREAGADRFGAVSLAPLLWQGDLPGLEEGAPLFVRDLGPDKNARVRAAFPGRTPWVFVPRGDGLAPELVDYDEAMRVLWGEPPPGAR